MEIKIAVMSTPPTFPWEISTPQNGLEGPIYVSLYYVQWIWFLLYKDHNTHFENETAFKVVILQLREQFCKTSSDEIYWCF